MTLRNATREQMAEDILYHFACGNLTDVAASFRCAALGYNVNLVQADRGNYFLAIDETTGDVVKLYV